MRSNRLNVMGFFYRHNIHPYRECVKRLETLTVYAKSINLQVIDQKGYDLENFIRSVVFRESNRCIYCYNERLRSTALVAKHGNFDYFSTTLLYSKFQHQNVPFTIMIFARAGKKGLKSQNAWACIASSTVAVYTVKKKGIIKKDKFQSNSADKKPQITEASIFR